MDQKRLKAKLFVERSAGNTRAANRAKGDDQKGEWQGETKGILRRKIKQGKWEERKPRDRNMRPKYSMEVLLNEHFSSRRKRSRSSKRCNTLCVSRSSSASLSAKIKISSR